MVKFLLLQDVGFPLFLCALFLSFPWPSSQASTLGPRELKKLSSGATLSLISHPDPIRNIDLENPTSHLSKILIPRTPDTPNNTLVKDYLVSTMKKLKWHVEEDAFTDMTPYGEKRFTNVIATKDPAASRRVVLAAHFDSKYLTTYPENQFVGATDSAAPCAFMLDLAETLDPLLNQRAERFENGEEDDDDVADTTLQLVFFDGEEAFKEWTHTDSIYGARHLANKWETEYIPPHTKRRLLPGYSMTEISTIEHLILLDLLGAPDPLIRSSFTDTAWLFDSMIDAERRLSQQGAFNITGSPASLSTKSFFLDRSRVTFNFGGIEDDHLPFLRLGVSVLHIIPNPFPKVWHKLSDDASALDLPTMRKWNLILRVFMAEYLSLQPEESRHSREEGHVQKSRSELAHDAI